MKVSDFIAQELVRIGVTYIFTLPGGFSQCLNDSIAHSALKPVYMLHESGAAFAATMYAQYTGGLGVCVVTSGPGSTNAITGAASAWQDSVPLLIISGEANVQNIFSRDKHDLRQGGPQDVPIELLAMPIVKYIATPKDGRLVDVFLHEAIRVALEDRRGPVWIAVPLDVQGMEMT